MGDEVLSNICDSDQITPHPRHPPAGARGFHDRPSAAPSFQAAPFFFFPPREQDETKRGRKACRAEAACTKLQQLQQQQQAVIDPPPPLPPLTEILPPLTVLPSIVADYRPENRAREEEDVYVRDGGREGAKKLRTKIEQSSSSPYCDKLSRSGWTSFYLFNVSLLFFF